MKISQKADYAVRAVIDLALHSRAGAPSRVAEIARRGRIPEKFLEAIVVDLRKAGLVSSRRGPEGGHALAQPPSAITLGMIRAAIDGPLALAEPAHGKRASRGPLDTGLREVWKEVEQAVGAVLDAVTVEELCRRVQGPDAAHDFSI